MFMGLGDLPGWEYSSIPEAMSADGSTVVGQSTVCPGYCFGIGGGV